MYCQKMETVVNQKKSAEEAERAVAQAQKVEIEEEEDLSKDEESSEEKGHRNIL